VRFEPNIAESLRKKEGGDAVPLGITNVGDEGGVPIIVISNRTYFENEKTRALMEKSLRQSKSPDCSSIRETNTCMSLLRVTLEL